MIGIFLMNKEGKLCFVRPAQEERPEIQSFRYEKESRTTFVITSEGMEEPITSEIAPELRDSFLKQKTILIADIDAANKPEREYTVPLAC
jgi:hypothetical protein